MKCEVYPLSLRPQASGLQPAALRDTSHEIRDTSDAMAASRSKAKERTVSNDELIREMAARIVRQFDPDRIILFGSHARGDAGPDSDVDLLIVMPLSGSRRKKAVEIGVALHDIRLPKDVIVTTPEEFEWRKDTIGTIEHPAWHEGRLLHAKA